MARRLVVVVLLLATACVRDGIAQGKKDTRTLWVFEGGWYAKEKDGSWTEMSEATFRANAGKPAKFGEAKNTKMFVDLHDAGRRVYIRLWDKHAERLNKKGDWEKITAGRWKTPE